MTIIFSSVIIDRRQIFVDCSNWATALAMLCFRGQARHDSGEGYKSLIADYVRSGHPEAIFLDATLGEVGERPLSESDYISRLKIAAAGDFPPALVQLSSAYYSGDEIPQNRKLAADLLRKAAELGHLEAQTLVGQELCFAEGEFKRRGLQLIEQAANRKYCKALEILARFHEHGELGLGKNPQMVADFRRRALESDSVVGCE